MSGQFTDVFASGTGEPEDDRRLPEVEVQPVWVGPPPGELGEAVPLSVIVGRSEKAVVAVTHAMAYSTGVTIELMAEARGLRERDANRLMHEQHDHFGDEDEPGAGFLRIGFELADGRRISNLGRYLWRPDAEPDGPVLIPQGGSGSGAGAGRFSRSAAYWLWPLPPAGPLRVFVEWPALDVSLTSTELEAHVLREAAARSLQLWET